MTVKSILMSSKKDLLLVKGINDQKLEKLIEKANLIDNTNWISALELRQRRENILHISTGSP